MSREWQQTKMKAYLMPNAVYYQSIWAVRDLYRMEDRLKQLQCQGVCDQCQEILSYDKERTHPLEKEILQKRIGGIRGALESIPKEYRTCILENIVIQKSGVYYPEKWRYWKQRFLYNVAKNLSML